MSSIRSASSSTRYSSACELRVRRSQVVEQAAGRRHEDVDAAAERVLLRPHADAAEDRGAGDRRVDGEIVEVLEDLRRQLARRREDERARGAARPVDEPVQDRQQEGGGLAAAGHGAGEDVAAGERGRDGLGLDGRRAREAEFLDGLEEARVQLEIAEWHPIRMSRFGSPRTGEQESSPYSALSAPANKKVRPTRLSLFDHPDPPLPVAAAVKGYTRAVGRPGKLLGRRVIEHFAHGAV